MDATLPVDFVQRRSSAPRYNAEPARVAADQPVAVGVVDVRGRAASVGAGSEARLRIPGERLRAAHGRAAAHVADRVVPVSVGGSGGGWGWRRVVGLAGRPASTVRGWLARFADRAQDGRQSFADLERLLSAAAGADMDRLVPAGGGLGDAVAQIGACLAALRRSRGASVFTVSPAQVVAVLSGGWLLGRRVLPAGGLWINTSPRL